MDLNLDALVAFIEARLGEDEAAAAACGGERWRAAPADILIDSDDSHWDGACVANGTGEDGIHIGRHDPARVLREVEAKRAILARYEDCMARMEDPAYSAIVAHDQAREYEDFVLPNVVAAWSDHPDYASLPSTT